MQSKFLFLQKCHVFLFFSDSSFIKDISVLLPMTNCNSYLSEKKTKNERASIYSSLLKKVEICGSTEVSGKCLSETCLITLSVTATKIINK